MTYRQWGKNEEYRSYECDSLKAVDTAHGTIEHIEECLPTIPRRTQQ